MKNKTKLFMTIMSICLVITLGVIGIFAVKKLDLNIGGSVNFGAEGVDLEVSQGKFYTDANHTSEYTGLVSDAMLGFSIDTDTPYSAIEDAVESWDGLILNLDERGDAYLYFTVKNNMSDTLFVSLEVSNGTQDANKNIEIVTITSEDTISSTQTQDFVFHFDIKDTDVNASLTNFEIDLTFSLVATQVVVNSQGEVQGDMGEKYTGVKYEYDEMVGGFVPKNNNASGEVVIASKVTDHNGVLHTITEIPEGAFSGNNITSLIIPEGVTTIGYYAFSNSSNLSSVVFPSTLKTIQMDAFQGCSKLESITFPEGLTSIEAYSFMNCPLSSISLPSTLMDIGAEAFSSSTVTSINLPEGFKSLGDFAFTNLKSLHLPSTIEYVGGENEFYYNTRFGQLESITMNGSNSKIKVVNNCVIDKQTNSLVLGCKNSVIPANENIINIAMGAFYGSEIEEVTIPSSVKKIGERAFENCTKLFSVTFSEGLENIDMLAFQGCTSLTTIVIPASVKNVWADAFYYCPIESLTFLSSTPPTIFSCGFLYSLDCSIYIPEGSYDNYAAHDELGYFADYFVDPARQ